MGYDRRHFHQLFCRLLSEAHTAPAMTGWRWDLGHFDDLLGNVNIELPAHLHQLVVHLQHRNIKRRHDERVVDDLFHGAPLFLFVCSFVRLFVCSFVRLFVCSFVCLFVCLFQTQIDLFFLFLLCTAEEEDSCPSIC